MFAQSATLGRVKPSATATAAAKARALRAAGRDIIALDAGEEPAIELKRELVNGQERTVWNPSLSIHPRNFDFTDAEVTRIKAAVEAWDQYGAAVDRRWLEPLLAGLSSTDQQ